jgi:hypothetical protein
MAAYIRKNYNIKDEEISPIKGIYSAHGNIPLGAALKGEHSQQARDAVFKELTQLTKIKSWRYLKSLKDASPSIHKNITPCSMFLKRKYDSEGNFLLWKARLVAGGHRTNPLVYEPFETNSPTVPMEVAMIQLGQASYEKAQIETFDIPCAYLNAHLSEAKQQLMRFPKPIADQLTRADPEANNFYQPDGTIIVQVQRALYGFPESARLWNQHFSSILVRAGYEQCKSEPCLFKRLNLENKKWSMITIYVDDCLHTYTCDKLRTDLYKAFKAEKNDRYCICW